MTKFIVFSYDEIITLIEKELINRGYTREQVDKVKYTTDYHYFWNESEFTGIKVEM